MSLEGLIGIIIVLGGIILVHEFGHFIVAKLSGMGVHEFSMGFGPALISKKRGETTYSLRMIPLGGYVRIAGMEMEDSEEEQKAPNSFENKPFLAKFMTLAAGAIMNFVLALFLFIVIGMAIGYPENSHPRAIVEEVMKGTPAAQAGIKPGDVLVAIAGVQNPNSEQAVKTLRSSQPPINIVVERDGARRSFSLVPIKRIEYDIKGVRIQKSEVQVIGVGLKREIKRCRPGESIVKGSIRVYDSIRIAIANILFIVTGQAKFTDIGGPVMVMRGAYDASKEALASREAMAGFLGTFALFSVLIGFFNLLPIPALDGSRLLFLTIEAIRHKPFDKKKEAYVHLIGMLLLLGLILAITAKDIFFWIRDAIK